jgi:Ca-activated chloride channel family protein
MHFASPWAFTLLALIPPAIWWATRPRRRAAVRYSALAPLNAIPRGWRTHAARLLPLVRAASLAVLIVALARPQHGIGRIETSTEAVALQVVIDRSGSMGQEMEFDGQPSTRLDTVKRVLREFVAGNEKSGGKLKGRRQDVLGLVTFARYAETVCPPVRDPEAVADLADAIKLASQRWEDGTAIGDGLALAAARLERIDEELKARPENVGKDLTVKSKVIILFTDGANNAGEKSPIEAANLAAKWGIKVYPIAIGTGPSYQVFRSPFGDQRLQVPSDVDTRTLSEIARITGGVYHSADDSAALREIYQEIDRLEKTSIDTVQYTDYEERFTPWAAAGLGALLLELVLRSIVFRRTP